MEITKNPQLVTRNLKIQNPKTKRLVYATR